MEAGMVCTAQRHCGTSTSMSARSAAATHLKCQRARSNDSPSMWCPVPQTMPSTWRRGRAWRCRCWPATSTSRDPATPAIPPPLRPPPRSRLPTRETAWMARLRCLESSCCCAPSPAAAAAAPAAAGASAAAAAGTAGSRGISRSRCCTSSWRATRSRAAPSPWTGCRQPPRRCDSSDTYVLCQQRPAAPAPFT